MVIFLSPNQLTNQPAALLLIPRCRLRDKVMAGRGKEWALLVVCRLRIGRVGSRHPSIHHHRVRFARLYCSLLPARVRLFSSSSSSSVRRTCAETYMWVDRIPRNATGITRDVLGIIGGLIGVERDSQLTSIRFSNYNRSCPGYRTSLF